MLREPRMSDLIENETNIIYDTETIYSGMIKMLNFDNNNEIPQYFEPFGFTKPTTVLKR